MSYLAWAVSIVASFLLGYSFGRMGQKIKALDMELKRKVDKVDEEAKSLLVDPTDEIQTAIFEAEQMRKKLNPNE